MANKTLTLSISGDDTIIDTALDAFVKQNGWTETIDGEPNQQTREEKAKDVLRIFIRETVKAWNISQASKIASEYASNQTDIAISSAIVNLQSE